jgi:hypothetical protein
MSDTLACALNLTRTLFRMPHTTWLGCVGLFVGGTKILTHADVSGGGDENPHSSVQNRAA